MPQHITQRSVIPAMYGDRKEETDLKKQDNNQTEQSPVAGIQCSARLALCYVDGNFAYFTSQTLDKQWGDDWDDAPYEHNAGRPYGPTIFYKTTGEEKDPRDWNPDGTPKWEIVKVGWEGDFETPADIANGNSPYSIQDINSGAAPWLILARYSSRPRIIIPAGVDVKKFKELINAGGGKVYFEG